MAADPLVIGVDSSTQSTKAIAWNARGDAVAEGRGDIPLSNPALDFWEQDPATGVILLYLESFGNARKFSRIARRVSAKKPIVAVKSGTTPAGSRAASSHTGALTTSEVASDAIFRHAGSRAAGPP